MQATAKRGFPTAATVAGSARRSATALRCSGVEFSGNLDRRQFVADALAEVVERGCEIRLLPAVPILAQADFRQIRKNLGPRLTRASALRPCSQAMRDMRDLAEQRREVGGLGETGGDPLGMFGFQGKRERGGRRGSLAAGCLGWRPVTAAWSLDGRPPSLRQTGRGFVGRTGVRPGGREWWNPLGVAWRWRMDLNSAHDGGEIQVGENCQDRVEIASVERS